MLSYVSCPACNHMLRIPEGQMGKRHTCPSCNSPFLAGKSEPEPGSVPAAPAPAPINKTMLGQTEPPIRYSCPRCKKALEDPASEAGVKKPCPGCGQRIQVPPPPATAPLNKTMLASGESQTPQQAPLVEESAPAPAGRRERCLECGRDVSEYENVFTCQDCGSIFCSSLCIREHRYHAHERRRRERPREPEPEPAPDNTGLIVGLILGGVLFVFLIFFFFILAIGRW